MISELKILIIDDDEDDFFISSQYLKEITAFDITTSWSYNIQDAQQQLASNAYDIYFLDYRLGAKTGLDLLEEAIQDGCYKPIILLTGKGNREIDQQAVEYGAYDYLVKSDLTPEKLERCLRYAYERYKSFKLINDNEKKYRLIFENALSFIFTCDPSMIFLDCNRASEYFIDTPPKQLEKTSFLDIVADEDRDKIRQLITTRKNIRNQTMQFISGDGTIKTGNLSLTFFETEAVTGYWQGIIYDETLRSQAEQAKLQAEKLEGTSRLVRTLAHEIRNPLTNIGLSLEGMAEEGLLESHGLYVDIIKRSAVRINDIITELLNSSKAIELKIELLDLNEILNEVLYTAQDSIHLKNIDAHVSLHHTPIIKPIDREKFKIALLNLVLNAIEATNKDYNLLKIELMQNLEQTWILIEDNGSGISEDNLKKLFEPYFTTKKTGMGLGLVSTLNIIKSHNAQIEVKSKVDAGTTFKIIFEN